jgi:hypothetical protein
MTSSPAGASSGMSRDARRSTTGAESGANSGRDRSSVICASGMALAASISARRCLHRRRMRGKKALDMTKAARSPCSASRAGMTTRQNVSPPLEPLEHAEDPGEHPVWDHSLQQRAPGDIDQGTSHPARVTKSGAAKRFGKSLSQ